tara:strand:+ start:38583 stop:38852 length:270 start_codon:yes stop_codon:yes gene_type:complete
MTPDTVVDIFYNAITLVILMVSVILIPTLIVGLIISVFQAATQINEITLSFVPKLITLFVVLIFAGNWLLNSLVNFSVDLITNIPYLIS